MKILKKGLITAAGLLCIHGQLLAATNSVQLDTSIPSADGLLTSDQIPPMMLPETSAPATVPTPAPAAAAPAPTVTTPGTPTPASR